MKALPVKGNPFADEAVPSTNYETTIVEDSPFENEDIPSTSYTTTVVEGSPFEDKEVFEPEFGPLKEKYKGIDKQVESAMSADKNKTKDVQDEIKQFPPMYYRGAGMKPEQVKEAAEDLKAYGRDL